MGSSTYISTSTSIGTPTSFPTPTSNSIWLPGNKLVLLLLQCDSVMTENRNQVSFRSWHVPNHHPNHQYDGSSSPSMLLSRVVEQWADIAAGDPNHHPNHHPNINHTHHPNSSCTLLPHFTWQLVSASEEFFFYLPRPVAEHCWESLSSCSGSTKSTCFNLITMMISPFGSLIKSSPYFLLPKPPMMLSVWRSKPMMILFYALQPILCPPCPSSHQSSLWWSPHVAPSHRVTLKSAEMSSIISDRSNDDDVAFWPRHGMSGAIDQSGNYINRRLLLLFPPPGN